MQARGSPPVIVPRRPNKTDVPSFLVGGSIDHVLSAPIMVAAHTLVQKMDDLRSPRGANPTAGGQCAVGNVARMDPTMEDQPQGVA